METKAATRPPRFNRRNPDVRRRLLIEATLRCLARYGYADTTVENICREADVSRGLISHHFDGKSDIIVQAYAYMADKLDTQARRILGDQTAGADDKLRAMIKASFRPAVFTRDELTIWLSLWNLARMDPEINTLNRHYYARYRITLANLIDRAAGVKGITLNGARAALSLTALMDGLWLEWCLDPEAFSAQQAERACLELVESFLRT